MVASGDPFLDHQTAAHIRSEGNNGGSAAHYSQKIGCNPYRVSSQARVFSLASQSIRVSTL